VSINKQITGLTYVSENSSLNVWRSYQLLCFRLLTVCSAIITTICALYLRSSSATDMTISTLSSSRHWIDLIYPIPRVRSIPRRQTLSLVIYRIANISDDSLLVRILIIQPKTSPNIFFELYILLLFIQVVILGLFVYLRLLNSGHGRLRRMDG
jgi:hypothetical protein